MDIDITAFGQHLDAIGKIVGALLVLLGAIYSLWKWIIPTFKSVKHSFVQMDKIGDIADIVLTEFRPNGGSSMRDAVTRIELNVQEVRKDVMRIDARQGALVASLSDPIYEANAQGLFTKVNSAFLQLTGRSTDEVLGNGWELTVHPDDRKRVWEEWQAAVARRRAFESRFRMVDIDGTQYCVRSVAHPYTEPNAIEVFGFLGRLIDIKELAPPVNKS